MLSRKLILSGVLLSIGVSPVLASDADDELARVIAQSLREHEEREAKRVIDETLAESKRKFEREQAQESFLAAAEESLFEAVKASSLADASKPKSKSSDEELELAEAFSLSMDQPKSSLDSTDDEMDLATAFSMSMDQPNNNAGQPEYDEEELVRQTIRDSLLTEEQKEAERQRRIVQESWIMRSNLPVVEKKQDQDADLLAVLEASKQPQASAVDADLLAAIEASKQQPQIVYPNAQLAGDRAWQVGNAERELPGVSDRQVIAGEGQFLDQMNRIRIAQENGGDERLQAAEAARGRNNLPEDRMDPEVKRKLEQARKKADENN